MTLSTQLEALAARATAGEWEATERSGYHEILAHEDGCDWYGRPHRHAVLYCDTELEEPEQDANTALIVALKNSLPTIIAALRSAGQ